MVFGERLKKAREEKGLTQDELGKRLNLADATINRYEKELRFPDKDTLIKIADTLNCSVDWLLGRSQAFSFCDKLRQLRNEKGLSQEELGKFFNLDKSTISLYESGKRQPDYSTLFCLAEFFDCSTDFLLGKTNERKSVDIIKEETAIYMTMTKDPIMKELVQQLPHLSDPEKQELWDQMQFAMSKIEKSRSRKVDEDKELLKSIEDIDLSQIKIAAHDEGGQPQEIPDQLKDIIRDVIIQGRKKELGIKE